MFVSGVFWLMPAKGFPEVVYVQLHLETDISVAVVAFRVLEGL